MVPLAADLARQQRSLRLKPTAAGPAGRPRPPQARASSPGRPAPPAAAARRAWGELADAGRTTGTFKEAGARVAARARRRPHRGERLRAPRSPPPPRPASPTGRAPRPTSPSWPRWSRPASSPTCPTASRPCSTRSTRAPRSSTTSPRCSPRSSRWRAPAATATCAASTPRGCAPCSAPPSSAPASACRRRARPRRRGGRRRCATAIDGAQRGLALLADRRARRRRGPRPSRRSSAPDHVARRVAGRATRILLDAGRLDSDTPAHRLSRRLSLGGLARRRPRPGSTASSPATRCCWCTTTTLLGLVDEWVSGLAEDDVRGPAAAAAPDVRARSAPPERRPIGEQLSPARPAGRAPRDARAAARPRAGPTGAARRGRLVGWTVVDHA